MRFISLLMCCWIFVFGVLIVDSGLEMMFVIVMCGLSVFIGFWNMIWML